VLGTTSVSAHPTADVWRDQRLGLEYGAWFVHSYGVFMSVALCCLFDDNQHL